MTAERKYLNTLKGLLVVLVVVGHFGQTITNNLPMNYAFIGQGIVLFIYLFHMPLFLLVSGYLSKNTEKRRKKAFQDLFIPYLLFQIFVGICMLILVKSGGALKNLFIPQMGAWYLLTLFSYRLVLPEVNRVRGILILGFLITIVVGLCTFNGDFAIKKTLGFFVYFMLGYKADNLPMIRIPRKAANALLIFILILFVSISWKTNWYNSMFAVLTRNVDAETFSEWYIAPGLYFMSFLATTLAIILVLNAIPKENRILEGQGIDTMPMYLSHLILFMAVSFFVNKNSKLFTVGTSFAFMALSIWLFSREWYRKIFNSVLGVAKTMIISEE